MQTQLQTYRTKTDAELRYIAQDASEAGRCAQLLGDEAGCNKYADQVNDACTVMGERDRARKSPRVGTVI